MYFWQVCHATALSLVSMELQCNVLFIMHATRDLEFAEALVCWLDQYSAIVFLRFLSCYRGMWICQAGLRCPIRPKHYCERMLNHGSVIHLITRLAYRLEKAI